MIITSYKIFENLSPQVGDYVICKDNILADRTDPNGIEAYNYILNTIGKISVKENITGFMVIYDSIPYNIKQFFDIDKQNAYGLESIGKRSFEMDEILYFGKTKQAVLSQQKGNRFDL